MKSLASVSFYNNLPAREDRMKRFRALREEERHILDEKGTERPFINPYDEFFESGVFVCKKCDEPLFLSSDKFASGCGWPSFDEAIPTKVIRQNDPDGRRIEIICAFCGGHLGHVFEGERLTKKDTRYCVNSLSMKFCPAKNAEGMERAIFAGGCFWGVEYWLQKVPGVKEVTSGYMGGHVVEPTYKEVCQGNTGHREVVEVIYDMNIVTFEKLAKTFFEIHDPTQENGQGPDIGSQYQSAIYYLTAQQESVAHQLIRELENKGLRVATEVLPGSTFYKAEAYHQNYYAVTGKEPYCHAPVKRF